MGPGKQVEGERSQHCLPAAQRCAQEPPGACTVITVVCQPHSPTSKYNNFLCNYPPDKNMHPPPSPSSSLSFYFPSLSIFLLSLHLPNKFNKVHIRLQKNPLQGHLVPQPGAALSLERTLTCSLISSKKA